MKPLEELIEEWLTESDILSTKKLAQSIRTHYKPELDINKVEKLIDKSGICQYNKERRMELSKAITEGDVFK